MSQIISGEAIAEKEIYPSFPVLTKGKPVLAIFFDDKDKVSRAYIRAKEKNAKKAKIKIKLISYPKTNSLLEKEIIKLNKDEKITGILLEMPFPKRIRPEIIYLINDLKDVDGFFSKFFIPPVVRATRRVLDEIPLWYEKKILVIGQGEFVGKKILHFLSREAQKVFTAQNTKTLKLLAPKSEIIISCVGKPNLVKAEFLKKPIALIDVGTSFLKGKIVGDIEDKAFSLAQFACRTPGGIGPLTCAYLFDNVWQAYKRQREA